MFRPSEERLKVKAFLSELPMGAMVAWDDIERKTGITMNVRGKNLVRDLLRQLRLDYRADPGNGIQLEYAGNAMSIVADKHRRVRSAIDSAETTTNRQYSRYADQLPDEDRQRLSLAVSTYGAIRGLALTFSDMYKKKTSITEQPVAIIEAVNWEGKDK